MKWWRFKTAKEVGDWHLWFAWHPVCLAEANGGYAEQFAWLEFVYRRPIWSGSQFVKWQYSERKVLS